MNLRRKSVGFHTASPGAASGMAGSRTPSVDPTALTPPKLALGVLSGMTVADWPLFCIFHPSVAKVKLCKPPVWNRS